MEKNKSYLIGLDLGSTGLKAAALLDGRVSAAVQTGMTYHRAGPVCEYDGEEYYRTVAALLRALAAKMPPETVCAGVAAVCASGNAVLLREGRPLTPVISWRDDRGVPEMEKIFGPLTEEEVHRRVGWHKVPKFPLAQLSWLRVHRPELLDGADMVCEGSCYIGYRLCGNFLMDHSTATTFYLQDQQALAWDRETLGKLGLREEQLPPLAPPGTKMGSLTPQAAADTGLPAGTPVVTGCYDGAAAARSAGLLEEDQVLLSCGTSWVTLYPRRSRQELLDLGLMIDPYLREKDLWLGMTSLGECSDCVDRALDRILPRDGDRVARFNALAQTAPPGARGLLFDPMRPEASGDLSPWSHAELCRGIMEGIAYSIRRQMEALPLAHRPRRVTMVGGPSSSALWPQIVSDVLELPVEVRLGSNACAVGAALLAGLGAGVFRDLEEGLASLREESRRYAPDPRAVALCRPAYAAFREKFPGLEENMH